MMKTIKIVAMVLLAGVQYAGAVEANFDGRSGGRAFMAGYASAAPAPGAPQLIPSGRDLVFHEAIAPGIFEIPGLNKSRGAALSPAEMEAEFLFILGKMETVYSHLENKERIYGFSYAELKALYLARVRACADASGYLAAVHDFMNTFRDPHLRAFFYDSPQSRREQLPPAVSNTLTADGVLITRIARLYGDEEEIVGGLQESLQLAAGARALVVDIRGNPGGNSGYSSWYISKLIAHAIPSGRVTIKISSETLARYGTLEEDPARPGWTPWSAGQIQPRTDKPFAGPIAVLIDGGCVSSCEGTALYFKFSGAARLYGARTMGSSGYPAAIPLPFSRGTVRIPTWIQLQPDGTPIEDHGIYPDVRVDAPGDAREAALRDIRAALN